MSIVNVSGRRKKSVARVYLKKGKGEITVNKKQHEDYFATDLLLHKVTQPFRLTDTVGKYDVMVNVNGGGVNGQAEAVRLAISKALVEINEEYKPLLKVEGLMRRDPRMVERKKPGQKKARKKFQFSKR